MLASLSVTVQVCSGQKEEVRDASMCVFQMRSKEEHCSSLAFESMGVDLLCCTVIQYCTPLAKRSVEKAVTLHDSLWPCFATEESFCSSGRERACTSVLARNEQQDPVS